MILLQGFAFILALVYILKNRNYRSRTNTRLKEYKGIPFLGFLVHFFKGNDAYQDKLAELKRNYGSVCYVRFGSLRCLLLNDAKSIKQFFKSNAFSGRPNIPQLNSRTNGFRGGIIFNDGPTQSEQRRFAMQHLKDLGLRSTSTMEAYINSSVKDVVNFIEEQAGNPISTRYLFNIAVLNSLWKIVTGKRCQQNDKALRRLVKVLDRNLNMGVGVKAGFFMPWLAQWFPSLSGWNAYIKDAQEIFEFWKRFAQEQVATQSTTNSNNEDSNASFLDHYISAIRNCTDENSSFYGSKGVMSLAVTLQDLFIAGSETTSTSLHWIVLYLICFPKIQKKVFDEICFHIGTSSEPTLSHRAKMPYTEAFLLESMRHSTLTPLGMLHATVEDTEIEGEVIRKGTTVISNIYAAHFDQDFWTDPKSFRPERFLSLSSNGEFILEKQLMESFLPFSYGKRACPAESLAKNELFIFVTNLVQRFELSPVSKQNLPSLVPNIGATSVPQDYKAVFTLRNKEL